MKHEDPSNQMEATLWQLYRRLMAEEFLQQRLLAAHPRSARAERPSPSVAAALTENLLDGDSLGLMPGDLTTRYLSGVPLDAIRDAALMRSPKRRKRPRDWQYTADAEHGLLPDSGAEQAALALGTALAARLHNDGNLTVLFESRVPPKPTPRERLAPLPEWAEAAETAVALQLPLLFITEAHRGRSLSPVDPARPAPALPSIPVDRCDTLALYRVIYESAARARTGGGPTWIDCHDGVVVGGVARRIPATSTARENMEQALRARHLFDRKRHRQQLRAVEKEFAMWRLDPA